MKRASKTVGAKGEGHSLHQRITAEIEGRILSGKWAPGFRIPFEIELAAEFGCSRMTMHKVLSQLVRQGLIERRRKAGSFVRQARGQSAVLDISEIRSEVEKLGLVYRYELVSRRRRQAGTAVREQLELAEAGPVLVLECLHFAGKRAFCREERVINLSAVPEAESERFEAGAPGSWLLDRVPWSAAEHVIRALAADAASAAALGIPEGAACLAIERRTRANDRVVTWVRLTYPGDLHSLAAQFKPVA